ncbi:MAG: hypothetical protein M3373_10150 [Gemmatimonadota bacterium]|nr:hypothetical protein [Gemmatimonadota bacterium]
MPRLILAIPVLALSLAACGVGPAPDRDAALTESLIELGDAVSDIRQENALLQEQLDSLRAAVARQDTALWQLTNVVGSIPVPMPQP